MESHFVLTSALGETESTISFQITVCELIELITILKLTFTSKNMVNLFDWDITQNI